MTETPNKKNSPGISGLLKSTLGAAFGVQSREVHEEDFQSKSPLPYIVAGIVFTVLFIGGVLLVVNVVLDHAS